NRRRHRSVYSVDQADAPILMLLNLAQSEPASLFSRRKEGLSFTRDERINNEPEFVHQIGIDETSRRSSAPDEIDVLALLLLEGGDIIERSHETRVWPRCRSEGV